MDFDRYIRQIAKKEPIRTPDGFGQKIENLLQSFAPRTQRRRVRRRRLPLAAAVLIAATLICGTAFAVNYILKMQGSEISYFEGAPEQDYSSQQGYLEENSDKVGMDIPPLKEQLGAVLSDTTGNTEGVTLTIDNIAMDTNYLSVFYTIHTEQTIRDTVRKTIGEGLTDEEFSEMYDTADPADWLGGMFAWPLADGKPLDVLSSGGRGGKNYIRDEHTFVGMNTFALADNIPETFTLTLEMENLLGAQGKWGADFQIDLSEANAKAKISYPKTEIEVREDFPQEFEEEYGFADYTHKVVVERVSLTENGGMVVLGEEIPAAFKRIGAQQPSPDRSATDGDAQPAQAMEDPGMSIMPFVNFMVYDQDGNALGRATGSGGVIGHTGYVRNILEFAADMDTTTSVTLVPYREDWKNRKEVRVSFDELGKKIEIFPGATVTLTDVAFDDAEWDFGEAAGSDCVTIKYIEKGVTIAHPAKNRFLGPDGQEVELESTVTEENPYVDFATGTVTDPIYVTFPDGAGGDVRSFTGMIFEYVVPILDEANAATIPFAR
ncbi:DUF4179 domain-containing protein [Christensenella intestinihominis]|uniref:DUF4179 domain-containing protein n=1 Tax=Christensenella intestinihominis TaxID=1851429 RepID=UPI00083793CE|nr:DUF4179 domain-containing protein [Christensenella intestinihominis]